MDKWNNKEQSNAEKWNRLSVIKSTRDELANLSLDIRKKGLIVYDTEDKDLLANIGDENNPRYESVFEKVGSIEMYIGEINDNLPNNWVICDGRSLLKSEYDILYSKIGDTYGSDELSFNLPDARDKFIKGDPTYNTGGQHQVTLHVFELPLHEHIFKGRNPGTLLALSEEFPGSSTSIGSGHDSVVGRTRPVGGDQPHENRPPFVKLNYIIKVR